MIICLAGFSGSGKSTLMQELQKQESPDWIFKDLDHLVLAWLNGKGHTAAETLGAAIAEIGLEKFRQSEQTVLDQTLIDYQLQNLLLSLGGGTLGRNLPILKKAPDTFVLGLDVCFETCWARIKSDSNRPLTKLGEAEMREKFTRRRALLLEADLILDETELQSPPTLQALVQKLSAH